MARPLLRGDRLQAARVRLMASDAAGALRLLEEGARLLKARGAYFAPTLYVGQTILEEHKELNIPAHQVERERVHRRVEEIVAVAARIFELGGEQVPQHRHRLVLAQGIAVMLRQRAIGGRVAAPLPAERTTRLACAS